MKIEDLYSKVKDFEGNLTEESKKKLKCKNGCYQCCLVDLSIFEIEFQNIVENVRKFPKDKIELIKNNIQKTKHTEKDLLGDLQEPCSLLKNGNCLIYEVRPLICRTQGLPLFFKDNNSHTDFVDICPLNESVLETMSNTDILNLDLINEILAKMNYSQGYQGQRIPLRDLLNFL